MSQDTAPETAVPEVRGDIGSAARETLEDYTLRFAPRSYRKWSTGVVAISALGGIAYLADLPSARTRWRGRSWPRGSSWGSACRSGSATRCPPWAVYIIADVAGGATAANQPVHQFLEIYRDIMPGWAALTLAVRLVVISQIKINVTNAYSGSLAWTNSFTRVTKHYPGRLVFLGVNLIIALILMEANMFDFLNSILGFYANCGMAWVVVVASDIVFNKYLLKISPKKPEFRRGMIYAFNPVGFGSMLVAAGVSIVAFFGGLGPALRPFSPDVVACLTHSAHVCSLCLSTDKTGVHVLPATSPA